MECVKRGARRGGGNTLSMSRAFRLVVPTTARGARARVTPNGRGWIVCSAAAVPVQGWGRGVLQPTWAALNHSGRLSSRASTTSLCGDAVPCSGGLPRTWRTDCQPRARGGARMEGRGAHCWVAAHTERSGPLAPQSAQTAPRRAARAVRDRTGAGCGGGCAGGGEAGSAGPAQRGAPLRHDNDIVPGSLARTGPT